MTADTERERVARMLHDALTGSPVWLEREYPLDNIDIDRIADAVIADRAQREAAVAVAVRSLCVSIVTDGATMLDAQNPKDPARQENVPGAAWRIGAAVADADLSTIAPAAADVERKLRERVEFARIVAYNYGAGPAVSVEDELLARARVAAGEG